MVALVIGKLSEQHLFRDLKDVCALIIEQHPAVGNAAQRVIEQGLFRVCFFDPVQVCQCDGAGIAHHRSGHAIQTLVFGKFLREYVRPTSETDQDMLFHWDKPFKPVSQWAQRLCRQIGNQRGSGV